MTKEQRGSILQPVYMIPSSRDEMFSSRLFWKLALAGWRVYIKENLKNVLIVLVRASNVLL